MTRGEVLEASEGVLDRPGVAVSVWVIGLAYRLALVPWVRFTGDESQFWQVSLRIARLESFPAFGPSLTGSAARHPGPAFHYLLALPQTLSSSPYAGSVFVALLHAVAGACVFRMADRAVGRVGGLAALALFMFGPWNVLYGSSIWLSSVAPAWATFMLFCASRASESRLAQGGLLFFVLTSPQFHMSAPVAWAAAAVVLVARWPGRWSVTALTLGLLGAFSTYGPALNAEVSSGFANTQAILNRGLGGEPWSQLRWSPAKTFGYAALMPTAEIGYHFARGYWSGTFRESAYYFSASGAARWLSFHGWWSLPILLSVVASSAAWLVAGVRFVRARAQLAPWRWRGLPERDAWALAIIVGVVAATALLMASKKGFFPHYMNVLTPVLVLPLAFAAADVARRFRAGAAFAAVAVIVTAMSATTVRYLRDVDRLNGLEALLSMTARIVDEPVPVRVEWRGFPNGAAMTRLAADYFQAGHWNDVNAPVTFVVHNDRPHVGPVPAGSSLHGAVLLERR